MRPLILVLILIVAIFTACKKETKSPEEVKEKFNISYQFINEGDPNVLHVTLSTTTFFPNDTVDNGDSVSIINWVDEAFSFLGANDIVTLPIPHPAFAGCIAQFKLSVSFKQGVYSPLFDSLHIAGGNNPNGYTMWRNYVGPQKIITSPADNIIKFRWPSDTALFTEVRFLH